jgi:hypothetical protein
MRHLGIIRLNRDTLFSRIGAPAVAAAADDDDSDPVAGEGFETTTT